MIDDWFFFPPGLFKTLLQFWELFSSTFGSVFEWVGSTVFGFDITVFSVMFGAGLFVLLGYWILKYINPFK